MEEVLPSWAQMAGWGGIVAAAVLSVFRGWLIPRNTVDRLVGQLEARLADRDALIVELRKANAAQDARSDLLQAQIAHLVALVENNYSAITAIPCAEPDSWPVVTAIPARVPGGPDTGGQAGTPPRGAKAVRSKGASKGRRRR